MIGIFLIVAMVGCLCVAYSHSRLLTFVRNLRDRVEGDPDVRVEVETKVTNRARWSKQESTAVSTVVYDQPAVLKILRGNIQALRLLLACSLGSLLLFPIIYLSIYHIDEQWKPIAFMLFLMLLLFNTVSPLIGKKYTTVSRHPRTITKNR